MRITQRQSTFGALFVFVALTTLALIAQLVQGDTSIVMWLTAGALIGMGALTIAYWRGWEYARHAIVVMLTIMTIGLVSPGDPFISVAMLLPPIMALVLTDPAWIAGSAFVVYLSGLGIAGFASAYANPLYGLAFLIAVICLIVGRLVLDTVIREARAHAHRAEQALERSEQQASDVMRQTQLLSEQNEQQRRLLDLVATLESPAVALADDIVLSPIVGALDSTRAAALTTRLLATVSTQRTKLVVLDISGVPVIDTDVARALVRAGQALRLLGCDVALTGISATVASTMTQLGIEFEGIRTVRSPQDALGIRVL